MTATSTMPGPPSPRRRPVVHEGHPRHRLAPVRPWPGPDPLLVGHSRGGPARVRPDRPARPPGPDVSPARPRDRAGLVTVRWHVRALLRDGLVERVDDGWRATASAMEGYPYPKIQD